MKELRLVFSQQIFQGQLTSMLAQNRESLVPLVKPLDCSLLQPNILAFN